MKRPLPEILIAVKEGSPPERNQAWLEIESIISKKLSKLRNKRHYEEILSDVRMKVLTHINNYPVEKLKEAETSWLVNWISNAVSEYFSSQKRGRNKVLSDATSLFVETHEGESFLRDEAIDDGPTPQEALDFVELKRLAKQRLHRFKKSKLEREAFKLFGQGFGLTEISQKLGVSVKQIDNAIQRVKEKIAYKKFGRKPTSGVYGIHAHKRIGGWLVWIKDIDGTVRTAHGYTTVEKAAAARERALVLLKTYPWKIVRKFLQGELIQHNSTTGVNGIYHKPKSRTPAYEIGVLIVKNGNIRREYVNRFPTLEDAIAAKKLADEMVLEGFNLEEIKEATKKHKQPRTALLKTSVV